MAFQEKLRIVVEAVTDKARAAFAGIGKDVADVDKKTDRLEKSHKDRMGSFAKATVAGFGVGQIVQFAKQIFDTGTALEAMEAKSETVFGGQVDRVRDWADENAAAMGLTSTAAVGAGAAIADLLKPMGFTTEAAADQTLKLLDLSAALAAWSGGKQDAAGVSEILTKAMLGEREQLKSLGISITEADVTARLAEKGQKGLTGATLAQAKALATQELIYEKSTDAQKAWSDGSMDATKDANKNKAAMDQLGETLAKALLPAVQALIPILTDTAELLVELKPLLDGLGKGFGFVGDVVGETTDGIGDLVDEMTDIDMLKPEITRSISDFAFWTNSAAGEVGLLGDQAKEAAQAAYELSVKEEAAALQARNLARDIDNAKRSYKTWSNEIDEDKSLHDLALSLRDAYEAMKDMDDLQRASAMAGYQQEIRDTLDAIDGIPEDVKTQIVAEFDPASWEITDRRIRRLEMLRDIGIDITTGGGFRGTADTLERKVEQYFTINVTSAPGASGTQHGRDIADVLKEWQRNGGPR